jgi:hypothetical protein
VALFCTFRALDGALWGAVREKEGTQAQRQVGTEWGPGGEGESGDVRALHSMAVWLRHHFVPSCLDAFVPAFSSPL